VKIFREEAIDPRAWEAFVARCPGATPFHCWGWRQVYQQVFGYRLTYLAAGATPDDLVAIFPLAIVPGLLGGRGLISLPIVGYAGLLAAAPAAEEALWRAAVDECAAIAAKKIETHQRVRLTADLPTQEHKFTTVVPIGPTPEATWTGQLGQKVRNKIRKARKEGIEVRRGLAGLRDFYRVYRVNVRDLGTPTPPLAWFAEIAAAFPGACQVYTAFAGGSCIAGKLTLRFRDTLYFLWAGALRSHIKSGVVSLLNWEAIEDGVAAGCIAVDFGRSTEGSGAADYKKEWRGEKVPLYWQYHLPVGGDVNGAGPGRLTLALSDLWKRTPLPITNTLGPRLAKYFP
jgi:FemAB-related protein (PEP-CTERM system-associated)